MGGLKPDIFAFNPPFAVPASPGQLFGIFNEGVSAMSNIRLEDIPVYLFDSMYDAVLIVDHCCLLYTSPARSARGPGRYRFGAA